MPTTGNYRPRITSASLLVRGQTTTARFPVYLDSVLTEPDSGTYRLYRSNGEQVGDTASVAVSGSVAQTTVSIDADEPLTEGWYEEWFLVFGSESMTFRRPAAVVRFAPTHTVSEGDLLLRHPELAVENPPGESNGDGFIEAAEQRFDAWLAEQGKRPWLVIPDGSAREPVILCALMYWFRSLIVQSEDRWAFLADKYERDFNDALATVRISYDQDEDGVLDEAETATPLGPSVTFLSDPPRGFGGW